jgi:hypothetical protein
MLDMAQAAPRPSRAYGRSLADFRLEGWDTPHGLLPLEEKLLRAAARGESCRAEEPPADDKSKDFNCVRGAFLRFLLLGGDADAPIHEKGVELWEAFVDGDIDLENAEAARPLLLLKCRVRGGLIGVNARLGLLVLSGSQVQDILCDGAHVSGRVFLRNGFTAKSEVRFPGAVIGGVLDCDGGVFKNAGGLALNCEGAHIAGNVYLRDGFTAEGQVGFVGARIGGTLDCRKGSFQNAGKAALNFERAKVSGGVLLRDGFNADGEVRFPGADIGGRLFCGEGSFKNPSGDALLCDRARIAESVFLTDGFNAQGTVRFVGATVGGDVLCCGGKFETTQLAPRVRETEPLAAADALVFSAARIQGALWLGPSAPPFDRHVTINGSLDLSGAEVKHFIDHPDSWPAPHLITTEHGGVPCYINLDGFVYEQFANDAPTDAKTRQKWLMRQPADQLGENFRMQPFVRLTKTLRESGHMSEARDIDYFRQNYLLRRSWKRTNKRNPLRWILWAIQWTLLEKGLGYGCRPHRMVFTALFVFVFCGYIYSLAGKQGLFAPTNSHVFMDASLKAACSPAMGRPSWTSNACLLAKGAPEYTPFNPFVYSLDLMLPVVSLGQKEEWRPMTSPLQYNILGMRGDLPGGIIQSLVWFEKLFAWVWSLSLSAVAANWVRRE